MLGTRRVIQCLSKRVQQPKKNLKSHVSWMMKKKRKKRRLVTCLRTCHLSIFAPSHPRTEGTIQCVPAPPPPNYPPSTLERHVIGRLAVTRQLSILTASQRAKCKQSRLKKASSFACCFLQQLLSILNFSTLSVYTSRVFLDS